MKRALRGIRKGFSGFIGSIQGSFRRKDYFTALVTILSALLIVMLALLVGWIVGVEIGNAVNFVATKFDILATLATVVGIIVWCLKGRQKERQDALTEQHNREQLENELAHQTIGESTYLTARQAMYAILSSIAPSCNLQTPEGLSSIEAPRHFISRDDMLIFQFVAVKHGQVNIRTITTLIEGRIQQMANAHELNFEPSTLVILGQSYSAIMTDKIHDYGSYVQIDIVFTTERYIKYRNERDHQNHQPPFMGGGNDHDFL